ncbi:MAG TPA: sigma-54 dependent transcriptional regulator [Rhodanobacteraceae bacterium]|nr:sigma-54 dependent transcriptional regulator [Rhodanobacteraceae bacterium]
MAPRTGHVLLVNGRAGLLKLATAAAGAAHCQLTSVAGLEPALSWVAKKQFDLILMDASSLGEDALRHFLDLDLTRQGHIVVAGSSGANLRNRGANGSAEHVTEPLSLEALLGLMNQALLRTPSREIQFDGQCGMIGRTLRMQTLFENIRRVAPLEVGVLVHGESGTGKEMVAQALHRLSGRTGEFVAVNCGAISPDLLSSHLFGHERGSFTGATQLHAGYFEQARGGTLFLDEITEMPLALQVYLLRVIETHSVTRVGGTREIPIDVRVIAASNRDLQHAVAMGVLRQDLYFRLLEFPLTVPPLRERREDIPLLAQHFLDQLNDRYGTGKRLSTQAMDALVKRPWPGNVRELLHTIRRQYITAGDAHEIEVLDDPGRIPHRRASDTREPSNSGIGPHSIPSSAVLDGTIHFSVGTTFEEIEREALLKTLAHFHNNKREAARALGISLKTVYNKLLRYRSQGLIGEDVLGEPEGNGRAA